MADTDIEWADKVWNPTVGCSRVSPGCEHCYAEPYTHRLEMMGQARYKGLTVVGPIGVRWTREVRTVPEVLGAPLKWKAGRRIFVNSMSDLFHEGLPFEYIAAVFGVMAACPQHTFMVLTKRPERAVAFFRWLEERSNATGSYPLGLCVALASQHLGMGSPEFMPDRIADHPPWPLPGVHLGVSCEDQANADKRIPLLLKCPAAVRWVSAEPLLGPVNLLGVDDDGQHGPGFTLQAVRNLTDYGAGVEHDVDAQVGLDWVVVGGESGHGARPCDISWIRSIVEQCKAADVPVFTKQLGANVPWDPDGEQWWKGPHTHGDGSPRLAHPKGGDIAEFPEDLRVRMFPGEEWPT